LLPSKWPGYQQGSVRELHREEPAFIGFLVGQYSPVGNVIHLVEKAEKMNL
jgi:hypothetical protein